MTKEELSISDATLIARLRECSSDEAMWSRQAADRIEELVKEVERRIEPEQVEQLIMLADPIMSELYAVECSYRQEAEAKLTKAVKLIDLAVELARWDLNPKLRDDMIYFTTDLKGESHD